MPRSTKAFAGSLVGAAALALLTMRTLLQVERAARDSAELGADAIVVFGAAAGPLGPCPELKLRLDHAASLFERGYAPRLICSGGRTGPTSEAWAMRESLLECGVSADVVEVDETGSSTRRTIQAIAQRAPEGIRRVIAVSSDYHMHRIGAEARRQGVACIPAPTPTSRLARSPSARLRTRLREVVATWWYALA